MSLLTRSDLGDLSLFREIAESGGFRKAADRLDMSPSALSRAMRNLEERQGVRLFHRTNRSVKLTPAGQELLQSIHIGFGEIESGLEALNRYRDHPAGLLRINVLSDAARLILAPILAKYTETYPDVRLEIAVQDTVIDIINNGFDAGIRYGDNVPEDMIALRLCNDLKWIIVASPDYLELAPPLKIPADLHHHHCIGTRMGNGKIYHWELEQGEKRFILSADWSIIVNETILSIELAEKGGGICYNLEHRVAKQLADGSLVRVLPEWGSIGEAFYLYYSNRRQLPKALRALIDFIKAYPI
ncbi:DNA-binding transcriptional regulator [Commensalibacter communis]|uniref:LysR family transcriptional regulator n=1 Tax=Commensalibacter communis TaxID=2972786 RepID=UPI0022FF88E8|nr:LysR family transcriptional regulator [Commensalibacter communis]CAI3929228.1 DNA-binding transcriptional regulator [Commensalibacter communis]CAI3930025.1 DNA-binding transcriptional regulator [Commensalibacter communis]